MAFMNNYRKGWALRYIREAKAELQAARKIPRLAPTLMLEALRKAQFAIYYSLGDPSSIERIVKSVSSNGHGVKDPILKCLLEIDEMVEFLSEAPELNREQILRHVNELISIASEIVELFAGEKD
ncbi:MAG TPA: hypothetical protein ENG10_02815 [Candidatus Bathyarchaeota archaeon]|nr:hypothetical protein [Candidatus Bathyarchaeota archaeon]HEX69208.1 hypothetical protein [Candidatus Bathyarchaeota archaeon]